MVTKKKVAGKKVVVAVKKTSPKKKAVKKAAPKKKVAAKKVAAPVKKTVSKKKAVAVVKKTVPKKKAVAKKVVAKKIATIKKTIAQKKTTEARSHGEKRPVANKSTLVEKTIVAKGKQETANKKPLSRNQQKKSSAKKRSSERESLLDATYTANPKLPKNKLPIDSKASKLGKSIVNAIAEKKGDNVVCIDLRDIENRVCDYFIICDGTSSTQIDAIAGSVEFMVKKELGERPYRSEGYENKTWILIDYVNVIVHVFDKETRHFYNLESLWADGERIKF